MAAVADPSGHRESRTLHRVNQARVAPARPDARRDLTTDATISARAATRVYLTRTRQGARPPSCVVIRRARARPEVELLFRPAASASASGWTAAREATKTCGRSGAPTRCAVPPTRASCGGPSAARCWSRREVDPTPRRAANRARMSKRAASSDWFRRRRYGRCTDASGVSAPGPPRPFGGSPRCPARRREPPQHRPRAHRRLSGPLAGP